MSMSDPIADLLTRLRNGQQAGKPAVEMPSSKLKVSIAKVLKQEGYISDYRVSGEAATARLEMTLKYYQGNPVIEQARRISRPGRRVYSAATDLPRVSGGLGVALVSTSRGLMTDHQARAAGIGGEVLCSIF